MDTTRRRKTVSLHLELPNGASPRDNADLSDPNDDRRQRRKRKRKRRHKNDNDDDEEESFLCLFLRTGTVIAFLFLCSLSIYRHYVPPLDVGADDNDDAAAALYFNPPPPDADSNRNSNVALPDNDNNDTLLPPPTIPPLPAVNLSTHALAWDAFALAAVKKQQESSTSHIAQAAFWRVAAATRRNFTELYGNDELRARALLDRGLTLHGSSSNANNSSRMPDDLRHLACRLLAARQAQRPFYLAFGGYSVTAGRGNYFHQAYPAVLQKILHPAFVAAGLVPLQVRNAAIGGCPSFPYAWCLRNFLGSTPDVVSWDFSMNEAGGDPSGLEAYLRRIWHDFSTPTPQVIVRDTYLATERRLLLDNYTTWFPDVISMHTDPAVAPYLKLPEAYRPPGFQAWRQFGAPKGAPGQALHHPAVAEHRLMAYLLAMHYLAALELVVLQDELDKADENHAALLLSCPKLKQQQPESLPKPFTWKSTTTNNNNNAPWQSLFLGDASRDWRMTDISCRTSFEPIVDGDLQHLIVDGSQAQDLDILKPRSKMFYNKGWTLDLAHEEKQAKKNLLRYGGLGFIDSKKAYYGIEMSGWLRMILPFGTEKATPKEPQKNDLATKWFRSVVICQVHDRTTASHVHDKGAQCQLDQDVDFMIGGVNATASIQPITASGSLYLGKKVCYHLVVPDTARLTTWNDLFEKSVNETRNLIAKENQLRVQARQQPLDQIIIKPPTKSNPEVGLAVEMRIRNLHIYQVEQACSVAHVIWEQV